jgi:hypothetical protein
LCPKANFASDPGLLQLAGRGKEAGKKFVLAKTLSTYHGFHCTVLFAINPKDGTIDPNRLNNTSELTFG